MSTFNFGGSTNLTDGWDWDSGWTVVTNGVSYDLNSTAAGAFSDTSKVDAATGATDASAELDDIITPDANNPGFIASLLMIKRKDNDPGPGPHGYDDYLMYNLSDYDDDGFARGPGYWMVIGGVLTLFTAATNLVLADDGEFLNLDWTNSSANQALTDALFRIKFRKP